MIRDMNEDDVIKEVREKARDIAESLRGTCDSLDEALDLHGSAPELRDHPVFLATLDEEVFECQVCNWWCDRSEESEDHPDTCEDCAGKEGDECLR